MESSQHTAHRDETKRSAPLVKEFLLALHSYGVPSRGVDLAEIFRSSPIATLQGSGSQCICCVHWSRRHPHQ